MVNYITFWSTLFQERVIVENEHWVWLVPYWAMWPFETMLLPKTHVLRIEDLTDPQRHCKSTTIDKHAYILHFLLYFLLSKPNPML